MEFRNLGDHIMEKTFKECEVISQLRVNQGSLLYAKSQRSPTHIQYLILKHQSALNFLYWHKLYFVNYQELNGIDPFQI